jgi:hypothetical protein
MSLGFLLNLYLIFILCHWAKDCMTWQQRVDSQSGSQRPDLFLDVLTPSVQRAAGVFPGSKANNSLPLVEEGYELLESNYISTKRRRLMENQQGRGAHVWAERTFQNTWLFQLLGVPYRSKKELLMWKSSVRLSITQYQHLNNLSNFFKSD